MRKLHALSFEDKLALVDKLMAENPEFICHAMVLSRLGVAAEKVEVALHAVFLLNICYEQERGKPMPIVSVEYVMGHRRRVKQMVDYMHTDPPEERDRTSRLATLEHPQANVYAWLFGMLDEGGISKLATDDDAKVIVSVLTLLSVFTELVESA